MRVKINSNIESVAEVGAFLKSIGAQVKGASLAAKTRAENPNLDNNDVILYLAKGGRDIRFDSSDEHRMIVEFKRQIDKKLALLIRRNNRIARTLRTRMSNTAAGKKYKTKTGKILRVKRMADTAAIFGLRKAMLYGKEKMATRLVTQETTDAGAAKAVTKQYAAARARKYGVPNSTSLVFKATGQLLDNINSGTIKLHREPGFAEKLSSITKDLQSI